ncbi:hypothetical protein DM01DRAFT_1337193, partial [Hesseltinella vesiculosa]
QVPNLFPFSQSRKAQVLKTCRVKKSIGYVSVDFLSSPLGIHFPRRHIYPETYDI